MARLNGHNFSVKVQREDDEVDDDESCQQKSADVVRRQVVPLWAVGACFVGEIAETVVRQKVESFHRRSGRRCYS